MASIRSLLAALTGARSSITDIDREVARLQDELAALDKRPPDTASFKAWVVRGLDAADSAYVERCSRHWNADRIAEVGGGWIADDPQGATLLATHAHRADRPGGGEFLGMARDLATSTIPPDIAGLTYFLRPAIESRLDVLIARAFPELAQLDGISDDERRTRRAKLDARLATLTQEREDLARELAEAARAAA